MSEKHIRFGKYLLLDHLVDGGMAKISRARYLGEQSADKIVAIKMVQPQYSQDPNFKKMFMDEINVTFGLIHPNIVQTYDYGSQEGQLFVAMEYCDGKNLKEYLDKLKEKKFVFPVEISVYIATQACQGLHYAHTLTDKMNGHTLNIVHRDISPHNIMLTYDGAVKVIDFGIAKAETNSEATQAGTIKGKLSYLAPEYLEGMQLDPRYDEFAIGITLWEMLCSRKLFKAQNDLAVLKKIQECKVPAPSAINPNVPKELDEIVLKALSKDRNKRYENLEQLNRALIKFLYASYPDFNSNDLSYFAKELFKEEIKKDREKFFEFGKIDLRPYLQDLKSETEGGTKDQSSTKASGEAKEITSGTISKEKESVIDFGFSEEDTKKSKIAKQKDATSGMRSIEASKSNGTQLTIDLGQKNIAMNLSKRKEQSQGSVPLQKRSQGKRSSKSGQDKTGYDFKVKNSNNSLLYAVAGIAVIFSIIYFQYPDLLSFIGIDQRTPASGVTEGGNSSIENVKPKMNGTIVFSNYDKIKNKVFLNGSEVAVSILGEFEAPLGDNIIRVQENGKEHFVTTVVLNAEASHQKVTIPDMKLTFYGYLWMTQPCVTGTLNFNLFGEKRVEKLPMSKTGVAFPIGIQNEVFIQLQGEAVQRKVSFKIDREDDSVDLCSIISF